MPDEQHPEWWYTAVYAKCEWWSTFTVWTVYAQRDAEPGYLDTVLARFFAEEPARLFADWWNETHAAPGAPTTANPVEGI